MLKNSFQRFSQSSYAKAYMALLRSATFQRTLAINISLLRSEENEFCKISLGLFDIFALKQQIMRPLFTSSKCGTYQSFIESTLELRTNTLLFRSSSFYIRSYHG
jgi:hypothetical protein